MKLKQGFTVFLIVSLLKRRGERGTNWETWLSTDEEGIGILPQFP
jgi:hypothetical protein